VAGDRSPVIRAQLERLILGLPWTNSAPANPDAIPAAKIKYLLAHDMARTLLVEGLPIGPHNPQLRAQRASELRALESIAQGRITKTVRLKLCHGTVPGVALVRCYLDLNYTDAAMVKAAAVVASASNGGRKSADHQVLNIARRCRAVYEMATGRPGNLSASRDRGSDKRKYVGLFPFVAEVFRLLGIEAKASGCIKTIENERRAAKSLKGTKKSHSLGFPSPHRSALIRLGNARFSRAA
jgi:hypothetical protein